MGDKRVKENRPLDTRGTLPCVKICYLESGIKPEVLGEASRGEHGIEGGHAGARPQRGADVSFVRAATRRPPPQAAWPAMPGGGLLETLGGTTRGPKFGPASRCMKIDERYARESSECDSVALLQEN